MSSLEESSDTDWAEDTQKKMVIKKERQGSYAPHTRTKYQQRFCPKWLTLFEPWLTKCQDDPNSPFCRACQCRLNCNRCHLQRHERTSKHAKNLAKFLERTGGTSAKDGNARSERSKYSQSHVRSSADFEREELIDGDFADEDYRNHESDDQFQFVTTTESHDQEYEEEDFRPIMVKQEVETPKKLRKIKTKPAKEQISLRQPPQVKKISRSNDDTKQQRVTSGGCHSGVGLLMQIRKEKYEMMKSFKDLIGQQQQKEKTHVDLFFESAATTVKAFSPKLMAETKMRVSQVICEMELRQLNEEQHGTSANEAATHSTKVIVATVNADDGSLVMGQEQDTY